MDAAGQREFEQTCLPLMPDLRAFALSLTRNLHDAEDLVQDTLVRAHRAFASFTPGTNAKAWLFTILRRLHIDRYRRQRVRPTPLPEDELIEMAQEGGTAPLPQIEDLHWHDVDPDLVIELINQIPHPFRSAVRLRDLDGFSYREIGEVLGVPAGTVMSRLHRGREYLRGTLVPPPGDATEGASGS